VRDDRRRLLDILDAIDCIERYVRKGRGEFDQDELIRVWIVHHLQVIGEAARGTSRTLRTGHPEVPWPDVIALRNLLVHEYFGIDAQQVWDSATIDVPPLRHQIELTLRELEAEAGGDSTAE